MSIHFLRNSASPLRFACVAVFICSVSMCASSDEPNIADQNESLTKPSMELAFEDWHTEMSKVNEAMTKVSANIEKAFEQTKTHFTKFQEAAVNFQEAAMRNMATAINATVTDLSESIPKWRSKWMSRIDRLDNDGDGALNWDEVSSDSQKDESQVDSTDTDEKTFVVGSSSGKSNLESEFEYIDRNEDGKVDRAEIEQFVEELESVRQNMQDMVENELEPGIDEAPDKSIQ